MAKIYGERWRTREQTGQGGQGHVYLVDDLHDPHSPLRVLKRILNPKRHDRFEREIGACRGLAHPGIIQILDHSALSSTSSDDERMFLVMPWMRGGDLEKRKGLYKGSLDTVLDVGVNTTG